MKIIIQILSLTNVQAKNTKFNVRCFLAEMVNVFTSQYSKFCSLQMFKHQITKLNAHITQAKSGQFL